MIPSIADDCLPCQSWSRVKPRKQKSPPTCPAGFLNTLWFAVNLSVPFQNGSHEKTLLILVVICCNTTKGAPFTEEKWSGTRNHDNLTITSEVEKIWQKALIHVKYFVKCSRVSGALYCLQSFGMPLQHSIKARSGRKDSLTIQRQEARGCPSHQGWWCQATSTGQVHCMCRISCCYAKGNENALTLLSNQLEPPVSLWQEPVHCPQS